MASLPTDDDLMQALLARSKKLKVCAWRKFLDSKNPQFAATMLSAITQGVSAYTIHSTLRDREEENLPSENAIRRHIKGHCTCPK